MIFYFRTTSRFPGDYLLHPAGMAHGAFLTIATMAFQVYIGESDELVDFALMPLQR